jgi:hypothetical protein
VDHRFRICEEISHQLLNEPLLQFSARLAQQIKQQMDNVINEYTTRVLVFNPFTTTRQDLVTVSFRFPPDSSCESSLGKNWFAVDSETGAMVPVTRLRIRYPYNGPYFEIPNYGWRQSITEGIQDATFLAEVPPLGFRYYELFCLNRTHKVATSSKKNQLNNEYLSVSISLEDGSVSIHDKRNRKTYSQLNLLYVSTDVGDSYLSYPILEQPIMVEEVEFKGITRTATMESLQLIIHWSVDQFHDMPFLITYLLPLHSARLEIRIEFTNKFFGYRLRSWFDRPKPNEDDVAAGLNIYDEMLVRVDGHFDLLNRASAPYDHVQSQLGFVDLSLASEKRGITIANRGLYEYELDNERFFLTLFRPVDRMQDWITLEVPTNKDLNKQISVEFAIIPHLDDEDWKSGLEARGFNVPLVGVELRDYSGIVISQRLLANLQNSLIRKVQNMMIPYKYPQTAAQDKIEENENPLTPSKTNDPSNKYELFLIPSTSLIELLPSSTMIFSTLKKAEQRDSLIARFFSLNQTNTNVILRTPLPVIKAYKCDLKETRISPLDLSPISTIQHNVTWRGVNTFDLIDIQIQTVRPKEIVSIELEISKNERETVVSQIRSNWKSYFGLSRPTGTKGLKQNDQKVK